MSIARRHAPHLPALAIAATLAGCGSSSPPATPAVQQFAAQANAICGGANARVAALPIPAAGGETSAAAEMAAAARLLDKELPIARAELASLRGLSPPAAERAAFENYVRVSAQELAAAVRVHAAAAAGDTGDFHRAVAALSALSPKAAEAASRARVAECARTVQRHEG